jgi:hypothetical protein
MLSGIRGQDRGKGPDFKDGSDVKAANTWLAIDTPRFNGCLPCGRTSVKSNIGESVDSLQKEPYLYFALWDTEEVSKADRCRVWVVRPFQDALFKEMAREWYEARAAGIIKSDNFQLHPPRNKNNDVLKNTYGTFSYPKLLEAVWDDTKMSIKQVFSMMYWYMESVSSECRKIPLAIKKFRCITIIKETPNA